MLNPAIRHFIISSLGLARLSFADGQGHACFGENRIIELFWTEAKNVVSDY